MSDYRSDEPRQHGDTAAYLAAIREHALLVVIVFALAAAGVMTYTLVTPDRYEAEADVLVTPISDDDEELKGLGLLSNPTGSVFTTARLLERPQVARRVTERLNLKLSRQELLDKIEITPLPQSDLVTIKARETSPERAAVLANTFAGVLIQERTTVFRERLRSAIARFEASTAERRSAAGIGDETARLLNERLAAMRSLRGSNDPTLEIWSAAAVPDLPKRRSVLAFAVAFFAALFIAAGAVLGLEFLDPRIHRRSSLPGGLTALAQLPGVSRRELKAALSGEGTLPVTLWDGWRLVRSRLVTSWAERESATVVLVTSPARGEGKTQTSCSLAVTIAAAGIRVALVDANLRDPHVAELFGVESDLGLAAVLERRLAARDALIRAPNAPGLKLLAGGASSQQIFDLLEQPWIEELFTELRSEADVIIVDSAGLTETAEAVALAAAADIVIGSVRTGQTRVEQLQDFAAILARLDVPVLGLVVHERRRARGRRVTTPSFRDAALEREPSRLRSEVA